MIKNALLIIGLGLTSTIAMAGTLKVSCDSTTLCPAKTQFNVNSSYFVANPLILQASGGIMTASGNFSVKSGVTKLLAGQVCGTINAYPTNYNCFIPTNFYISSRNNVNSLTVKLTAATKQCTCLINTGTTGGISR